MDTRSQHCSSPEIWGGIECTINRVNDSYFDQLEYGGHYQRQNNIDAVAELGIKAMRIPILWERHQPSENAAIDWSWIEDRLMQLKRHNIKPIAGLVHHGSGPAFTSLIDDNFAE